MSPTADRLFIDTAFIQALLNRRDRYHRAAVSFLPRVRAANEVWVTEAVLTEVGNALSSMDRGAAAAFIRTCYTTPNIHVATVDSRLFQQALLLYESRSDKDWGLTDCISFVLMDDTGLINAVTTDGHFRQAGFVTLL